MCTAFGLNILNGVCNGDLQGRYTFIFNCGNSVNDYFMVSEDLFSLIQHDCRLSVMERMECLCKVGRIKTMDSIRLYAVCDIWFSLVAT